MQIGTAKEIKTHEYRVGLTPACVKTYCSRGHTVLVETDAGREAGFSDEEYRAAGATMVKQKQKIFDDSDMIVKVKEPLPEEYDCFHENKILYTYLHLVASCTLTEALLARRIKAIAYRCCLPGRLCRLINTPSATTGRRN